MKKILGSILIAGVICFILIWGVSLIKCEILTYQYGKEFDTIYKANTMMGEIDYLKVLDYSDTSARVYYVSINKSGGDILKFSKKNGQWTYEAWERTVWAKGGSASEVIWPYWWHFIYGGL